jgi:hypothetical protein
MNAHQDTIVLINATPHDLAYEVRDGQPFRLLSWDGQQRTRGSVSGKTLLIVPPCGARFAAATNATGRELDSDVTYEIDRTTLAYRHDLHQVGSIANNYHGARCILVASTISAQGLGPELDLDFMVVDVRFPILATESVYLAPEQRWADRLGVPK